MVRKDKAGRKITRKRILAARRNIEKARKKWMSMSKKARRKAMPSRVKKPSKVYPVGTWITKDVGKPKHHYIVARKTKYGWEKSKLVPIKELQEKAKKAREVWMRMSSTSRKRVMPQRKGVAGYKKVAVLVKRNGKWYKTHRWIKIK